MMKRPCLALLAAMVMLVGLTSRAHASPIPTTTDQDHSGVVSLNSGTGTDIGTLGVPVAVETVTATALEVNTASTDVNIAGYVESGDSVRVAPDLNQYSLDYTGRIDFNPNVDDNYSYTNSGSDVHRQHVNVVNYNKGPVYRL